MIVSLEEVKRLYRKALCPTETPRSLTEEESTFVQHLVSSDSQYTAYLTSLNLDLIWQSLIDFSRDEKLINQLNEVTHFLECDLRSTFRYPGHIVRVGSCRDESRVGRVNEMDTLYVIDTDFTFECNEDEKCYGISIEGISISALELISDFAVAVETSAQKWQGIHTQSRIQHGGFDSPRFTGVRYNGPAVTLLFTYESQARSRTIKDVSLDMTLALNLPPEHAVRKHICEQLSIVQQIHTGKVISKEGVHFVPNVMNGLWMMTTAQLEADLFYSLPNKSVLKRAFRYVKIISHDVKKHSSSKEHISAPELLPISTALDQLKTSSGQGKHTPDPQTDVTEWLRYAHCFLSAAEADRHDETVKEDISINTAALKHVLVKEALTIPRYFDETSNADEDVYLLVVKALEVLSRRECSVPHSFIQNIQINLFSFSKRALLWNSRNMLEAIIREKFRRILHKTNIVVQTSADTIETESDTNIVIPLKPYLVPNRSIHGQSAAEYLYEVSLDPSISPKRCPKIHHIQMLINGLQNSCGGKIAITTDVIVAGNALTHWRQQLKQCLPPNVHFEESLNFNIHGSVLLAYLRVYPTELEVYSYEAVNDHQVRAIYFLLCDDGHIEKIDHISESSHLENLPSFLSQISRDMNTTDRRVHGDITGSVKTENQGEPVVTSDFHMRRSYSFRKTQDIETLSVDRSSSLDKLDIFKESSPVHFTPPLEDLGSLLKTCHLISDIERLSEHDALAIASGDFLASFDNALYRRKTQLGVEYTSADTTNGDSYEQLLASKKLADIIYFDTQPVVIFNSVYDADKSSISSHQYIERTFEEARVFMKRLKRHIGSVDSTEELFVFPVTHWADCREHKLPDIKPCSLQRSKLKEGLGRLLLQDNMGFSNMINNDISIYLTGEQIATVQGIELLKFCVVEGAPGSGKTLLEQHLCQRLGKEKCAILCSNKGVKNCINHQQKAEAFFIEDVAEALNLLNNQLKTRKYIIVDDAQYMVWEQSAWRSVFSMIHSSNQRLFIFMDSRHQIYKGAENVRHIRSLVVEYDGYILPPMQKIYRNSNVIFQYMKCTAMDDDYEETFQCLNPLDGDDVKLTNVPYLALEAHSNGLLTFVRNLLEPSRSSYRAREVAVLFDVDNSAIGPDTMRDIFRKHWPESRPQTSEIFPVGGIVIDKLDNFLGLESRCVIVVLGDSCDLANARYKTTVASRAVERLELVKITLFDDEAIHQLHFENSVMDQWAESAEEPDLALMEGELGQDDHPLLHSCQKGDKVEVERQLIVLGISFEKVVSRKSKMTPLMIASFWGHRTVVKHLIDKGVNLEAEDKSGRTAVYWADTGGSRSVLKELFTRGAHLEGKRNQRLRLKGLAVDGEPPKINAPKDAEEVSTLSVGSRIYDVCADDFKCIDNISRGEYGIVDRMLHVPSRTVMAVKRIPYTAATINLKGFLKDFDMKLRTSDYPYTVLSHGTLFLEGVTWICMELMDTSVDKFSDMVYTNGQRIPENILAKIAFSVISGLHYLKEMLKMIHRDVKPGNILVNRKGEVKVGGFGITSHLTDSVSMTSRAALQKPYMAPERISSETGGHRYDIRSDVWSLGIVMLELATGVFPFHGARTSFEMLKRIVGDAPPQLPAGQFSEDFNEFSKCCLQKSVTDRASYSRLLQLPFIRKYEQDHVDVAAYVRDILDKYDKAANRTP